MRDGTRTKELIEKTALRLFVEKGIAETTIRDISSAAGIAEGTMYRHFASKEGLARELFVKNLSDFAGDLESLRKKHKTLKEQIEAMVRLSFSLFDEDPILFRYILLTQHSHLEKVTPNTPHPFYVVRDAITEGIRRGEVPEQDTALAASMVFGLIRSVIVSKVLGRVKGKLSKVADNVGAASWRVLKK